MSSGEVLVLFKDLVLFGLLPLKSQLAQLSNGSSFSISQRLQIQRMHVSCLFSVFINVLLFAFATAGKNRYGV